MSGKVTPSGTCEKTFQVLSGGGSCSGGGGGGGRGRGVRPGGPGGRKN